MMRPRQEPCAEAIAIGTELLLGTLVDSNSALLGRELAALGLPLYFKQVVGDNEARIAQALELALGRASFVFTCGGLGPTVDDVTRTALAAASGRPLKQHPAALKALKARFARARRPMSPNNLSQALVPQGALPIPNAQGTAPGLWITCRGRHQGKVIVALPGPPSEFAPLLQEQVIPRLLKALPGPATLVAERLLCYGLGESGFDMAIRDLFEASRNPAVAMYAHGTHTEVRLTARAKSAAQARALIRPLKAAILKRLEGRVFSETGEPLESVVGGLLKQAKASLALAESCTGGLVASRITSVAGASAYFKSGVVTYENAAKIRLLGVPLFVLEKSGAVSKECSLAMAVGLARKEGADYCLAITGIAGPEGGSGDKPVGLVHLALAGPLGVWHQEHRFLNSDRKGVQARAAQAALWLLYCMLTNKKPPEIGEDRGQMGAKA
jgi:nicotinamide-nucleotide amidase